MRLVFDIEGNGLLKTVDTIWMVCATDLNTGIEYDFCDYNSGCKPLYEFRYMFNQAEYLIGHYILGYDIAALEKVLGWKPNPKTKFKDTMIMSQVLNYNRFMRFKRGQMQAVHNLETWGEHFGIPKPEHEDWLNYSDDMLYRCRQDRLITIKTHQQLCAELITVAEKKPQIKQSLRNEQDVLKFCTEASIKGWPFDKEGAVNILDSIQADMSVIERSLVPLLPLKVKQLDKGPKLPKWIKSGHYDAHTARYFNIEPEEGLADFPLVMGPYSRIEFQTPDMGNIDSVKELLTSIGWEPDDWQWKRIGMAFEKGSAKLTTSSLLPLGEVGKMVDDYYTLRSRYAIVDGWAKNCVNGRVYGDCFTIATPTGRARHNGIVNVPGAEAVYGKAIRQLFTSSPGKVIIGADSSGNQMRAFCHYLKNDEYTKEVLDGDVHTKNMEILQEVVPATTRKLAKPFLYAFLFGGGSEKLALIIVGKRDKKIGKKLKDIFIAKIPGLGELITKITRVYDNTLEREGSAWIPGLDGRKVFVDSPHKALNYLLQSFEAITCKAAVAMLMKRLDEENIPWEPRIFYHDEVEFEVDECNEERARLIAKECFREAPKQFGAMIMDGEAKSGKTWYDVH